MINLSWLFFKIICFNCCARCIRPGVDSKQLVDDWLDCTDCARSARSKKKRRKGQKKIRRTKIDVEGEAATFVTWLIHNFIVLFDDFSQ